MAERKYSDTGENAADDFSVSLNDIRPLLELCSDVVQGDRFQNVDLAGIADPVSQGSISLTQYFHILRELSFALHDETVRLSERHLMPGTTGFIVSNLTSCKTLLDAMKLIAKTYNVLHGGAYNRVEERDGQVFYIIDDSRFHYMMDNEAYIHFTMECVLIFLHGMLSYISSDNILPYLRKVYVKRDRNTVQSRHMGFWTVPVRYQSHNYALTYDARAAHLPITIKKGVSPSSADIYRQVSHMIEERLSTAHGKGGVADRVHEAIESGLRDQGDVARHLGFSVATMRRRLREENTGFRMIRHQVLDKMAKQMLDRQVHVNEVAMELGFSDFRSFNRAFRQWNGMTPFEYVQSMTREEK